MNQQTELNTRSGFSVKKLSIKDIYAKINKTELAENVFLFLICRICFLGYLVSPFGVAYFAALMFRKKRVSYFISSAVGVLSLGYPTFALKYGGAILIICTIALIFSKELEGQYQIRALLSAAALFLNGMVYVLSEGLFLFDFLLLIFECGLAYLSFLSFDKATALIAGFQKRTLFEPMETASLVVLSGTVILSIAFIESLLPFAHILAITAILILGISCGFSLSCPAGVVFGLSLGLAGTYSAQTVCVYCLASLAAGAMKRFGKLGVSITFGIAVFVANVLLCPEANGIVTIAYVAVGALVLLFLPDRFLARFGALATDLKKEEAAGARLRRTVNQKFQDTVSSMDAVSSVFKDVLSDLFLETPDTHSVVFENTAAVVCQNCSLCKFCWRKDKDETQLLLEEMYRTLERKNTLTKADIPKEFSEKCIRKEPFLAELNKNYEAFKITKMWAGRVMESKRLVAEQFQNISMILKNMQENLKEQMQFEPELEQKIMVALDRRGITADKVSVCAGDGFSVTMDKVSCGENMVCATTVAATVSEVLEVPMLRENRVCEKDVCHLKFSQQTRFVTETAFASAVRKSSAGSGDTFVTFPVGNGKIAILISDGMGSGEQAQFLSSVTARLAQNLLTAGFDKETCVRLINNILMMSADRDTFATIDLALVNLYTGTMEFVKTGAVNSYVQTRKGTETVYASSLPAGLVHTVDPDYDMRYMHAGDYLIMVSDGVSDVLDTPDENEIFAISNGYKGDAQGLADAILKAALFKTNGVADDDMTVAVCAVSENM